MLRRGHAEPHRNSSFRFLRNLHFLFQSDYSNVCFHQQCVKVPCLPQPHQQFIFQTGAPLTRLPCHLIVLLISMPLMIRDAEHSCHVSVGHLCLFFKKRKTVHLDPLHVFKNWAIFLLLSHFGSRNTLNSSSSSGIYNSQIVLMVKLFFVCLWPSPSQLESINFSWWFYFSDEVLKESFKGVSELLGGKEHFCTPRLNPRRPWQLPVSCHKARPRFCIGKSSHDIISMCIG